MHHAKMCEPKMFLNDNVYPHDGCADKNPYPHDRRADKDSLNLLSVFESTAYLKFAKLQYVSSGFRCRECRVTDEALLAETT